MLAPRLTLPSQQFGSWARHFCSILQAVQLILNCGIITLSNGQGVSQIAKGNICFSVAIVIWAFGTFEASLCC